MSRTIMAAAFAEAGMETPRDRIDRMLREAIRTHGSNAAACVAQISQALPQTDAATVWEFFRADREARLWKSVEDMIRRVRQERGLDAPQPKAPAAPTQIKSIREGHASIAEKAAGGAPSEQAAGSGHAQIAREGQGVNAAPVPHASPTLRQIAETSLLMTFQIDGRPIGECTAWKAREWGKTQRRNGKFAELLAEGLQPGMIIGQYKTEADAELAARLSRENDNG